MVDDIRDIAAYYDSASEIEHSRLERHQLEYDVTWRYLNHYLPARGAILEIGAATGRYTLELAKRGYAVTAVDLSATLIEQNKRIITREGLEKNVRFVVADARDLSQVAEKEFDAVLLMGPLYHLVEEADRKEALRNAFERLKKGGIIFSSFISRLGVLGDLMKDTPAWIEDQAEIHSVLAMGRRADDSARGGFRGYFAKVSEIAPLHEDIGFETLKVAGVEPAISADDESYNRLQGNQRQLWLDLLFEISAEPQIIATSRHLLYVGRK